MLKLFVFVCLLVLLSACGVDTDSSSPIVEEPIVEEPISLKDLDLIDQNPIDSDVSNPDITDPDSNITDPDSNITDPDSNETYNPCAPDCLFDDVDALYDENTCNASTYDRARDASYNGDSLGENGAGYFSIEDTGLQIKSEHLESVTADSYKTWVTLFYKPFPDLTSLNLQGASTYRMSGVFSLFYDKAWADESIPNIDNVMYIQSAQYLKPTCYRVTLNSMSSAEIDVQKVYR